MTATAQLVGHAEIAIRNDHRGQVRYGLLGRWDLLPRLGIVAASHSLRTWLGRTIAVAGSLLRRVQARHEVAGETFEA